MVKNLFFTLAIGLLSAQVTIAQNSYADSLVTWLNHHPIDSLWILNAHRVSYRLSETDVKKSFTYYEKVSASSDSLDFTYGKALAQINLALLLFNSANFVASNEAYFKAISYAEPKGYDRLIAVSLNNIGENFKILNDYDKCREYTQQAIRINTKLQAWRGVAINYELLYRCNMDEKKYGPAQSDLKAGIGYAEESKDSYIISPYYLGFGKIYEVNHRSDSAGFYFNKALQEAKLAGDLRNEYEVYLGRVSSGFDDAAQRLTDLHLALQIARQTEYLKGIADAADQLSRLYDGHQNKDSSLFYFRIYRTASDSLFSENNRRNIIIKESEWVLRRKDVENEHLKEISAFQQHEIVTKNSLLAGGAVTLVLAIALGILAFAITRSKNRRIAAEKRKQEAELKSQILDMEFKAFKAQLNPHFIFNYLNSISGYILLSQPEKASGMVKRFSKMLRTVLQNSEQNEVALADDIKTIEQYVALMSEIATPPFTYGIHATPELKASGEMVPPLFIQPYIENAIVHGLKHAQGKNLHLEIDYLQFGAALHITITDNGTGFQPATVQAKTLREKEVHLGLSLTEKRIQAFAEKNGYQAAIRFSLLQPELPEPGTKVQIEINGFFK